MNSIGSKVPDRPERNSFLSRMGTRRRHGFFQGEDLKVGIGGDVCRVDGRCREGVGRYQFDRATLVEYDVAGWAGQG
jgi:hypothetical protein